MRLCKCSYASVEFEGSMPTTGCNPDVGDKHNIDTYVVT